MQTKCYDVYVYDVYDDTSEPQSRVSQSGAGVRSRSPPRYSGSADDFTKLLSSFSLYSKHFIIPSEPSCSDEQSMFPVSSFFSRHGEMYKAGESWSNLTLTRGPCWVNHGPSDQRVIKIKLSQTSHQFSSSSIHYKKPEEDDWSSIKLNAHNECLSEGGTTQIKQLWVEGGLQKYLVTKIVNL